LLRDRGAGRTRCEHMQPRRHLALARRGKARVKFGRDDEAENAIAEKLEPLIVGAPGAAVRQCKVIECDVVRNAADDAGKRPGVQRIAQKPSPMRSQRAAVNQLIGLIQLADPSVENMPTSAWPTRFSSGTRPMPWFSTAGKRLSALRSRLSPIRNICPSGTTMSGVLSSAIVVMSRIA